jgi:hypothetical protein
MFTPENMKQLQQDIETALKTVEKKYSVTFSLTYPRGYEPYKFNFKVEGTKASPYRDNYLKHAQKFGLDPTWLEQVFYDGGHSYIIQGFNPEKNSVIVSREKNNGEPGSTYGFKVEFIKSVKKFARAA